MPKKLDEIHNAVARKLKGKTNPQTKKPYTDSEMWAIARAQYNEWKKKHKSFHFYTPITKTWTDDVEVQKAGKPIEKDKKRFIEVTVSGLKEDRDNEKMSQVAIDDMIMQFKSGRIPFFPDHGRDEKTGQPNVYSWKQMMGVWVDAYQDSDNLKAVVRLNNSHPDADMFWKFIEEGMPIGFSIGGKSIEDPVYEEEEDVDIEEVLDEE